LTLIFSACKKDDEVIILNDSNFWSRLKVVGSLSGTLYYLSSDISTIEIEIPDFEILLLM